MHMSRWVEHQLLGPGPPMHCEHECKRERAYVSTAVSARQHVQSDDRDAGSWNVMRTRTLSVRESHV